MSNGVDGNGNGKFTMERELWAWRAMLIFILLMNLVASFVMFQIDRSQHAQDNKERAAVWQELKDRTYGNRNMIMKNYDAITAVDDKLDHCASCHTHPKKER